MEKERKITETLKFYEAANKLKTTVRDEVNNYSVSDNIYGSMILSIAMDSEYKESNNLGKILRMAFLEDFDKLNTNFKYSELRLQEQYEGEIKEAYCLATKESKLVNKYKTLDILLTNLLAKSNPDKNYQRLFKEANIIFSLYENNDEKKNEEIFKFFCYNFKLKNMIRGGWNSTHWNIAGDRVENISEHVVSTVSLALAAQSELEYDLDYDEVIKTLVVHEIGESIIGDITPHDGVTKEEKKELEHKAMIKVLGNLYAKKIILNRLFGFDDPKTKEQRLEHYIDKIDPDLQSKIYLERGQHHSLDDQKNNCSFKSSKVHTWIQEGAKTAFDIWYNWDKPIYENDKDFKEPLEMLNFAKDNELLKLKNGAYKKQIQLSKEENITIYNLIFEKINELYKDENIDSIILTNYQSNNYDKGLLAFTILLKGRVDYIKYDCLTKNIEKELTKTNNTNIGIKFDYDYVDYYTALPLNPSEVRRVDELSQSTIIFDKSNEITTIKDKTKDDLRNPSLFLIDYIPPIEKQLVLTPKKNIEVASK